TGATLAPPANLTVTAVNGVATFSGLNIALAGTAYRLTASSGALTSADSATFNIAAGAATLLIFTSSPSDARSGAAFATQPAVQARDAFGNTATSFSGAVTLVIKPGTGTAGASLAGTATVNAVAGVATFGGLSIDRIGTAYQLTASSGALAPADSGAFDITASGMTFTLQPATTTAGQPILVRVAAQDITGNTDATFTGTVTLAIQPGTGAAGATLGGTLSVTAVNGVADFTGQGLTITRAGTGYKLLATTSGLPPAASAAFDITPGPATVLSFTTSPTNTPAGIVFADQPVVEVHDQFGNKASNFAGTITLAIKPGTGTTGAALAPAANLTIGTANGAATFSGLNINFAGADYVLTATTSSLPTAESAAFNITATRLVFATSPSNATVGTAFPSQPVVRAEDSTGHLDATFNGAVTLAIKPGTGAAGATLGGVATLNAVNGVASFSGLSIDRVGSDYRLTSTSGTLSSADSNPFDILISRLYLPILLGVPKADLVGSFSFGDKLVPNSPTVVTVTITNTGNASASQFWVDFYVNPAPAPSDTNQRWDQRCSMRPCYGIAWYVDTTLAPGQSITLTSTPSSYSVQYTRWVGAFPVGTKDLYLYVDSWNPGVASGAVAELDETNNRAEYHVPPSATLERAVKEHQPLREERVPPRPARP
ncbi:MAG TPA: CARDB domain-containing protein, partial [Roseiflexaceae bacterium]|nr:CARDB domain-containing protein [Roseiflexaceae bacterium]